MGRRDVRSDPVERLVALVDHDVAQVEPALGDRTVGHTDHDEGQARPVLLRRVTRIRQAFVQIDQDGSGSLGRDRAAQLGEQGFGAQRFEDRETLPCRRARPAGGALGQQRRHGPDRAARRAARTPRWPGRRCRAVGPVVSRARHARPPGRARRAHGPLAAGRDELRRELPPVALRRRVHGRLTSPRRGHGDGSRLARARRRARLDARRLVRGGRRPAPARPRRPARAGPAARAPGRSRRRSGPTRPQPAQRNVPR